MLLLLNLTNSLLLNFGNSASNTPCFPLKEGGSLCFTQPHPPVNLSWASAMQWCKTTGATLPILDTYDHNTIYGNALDYFSLHTENQWLGAIPLTI